MRAFSCQQRRVFFFHLIAAQATSCVFQREDDSSIRGVELTKELMEIAGKTMRDNFTILGPQVS